MTAFTPDEAARVVAFGFHQPPHISPDCSYGKHHACSRWGAAWDETADRTLICDCWCHSSELMTRPRLLDLYSCAGGAAMGYHRAGFDVVGVDINPQPRYPFEHHVGDAIEYLEAHGHEFDAIHASPPCQLYTKAGISQRLAGKEYPNLVPPTRAALLAQSRPWVMENVPGSPIRADIRLCGCQFGLGVWHGDRWLGLRRERWFETSWHHVQMMPTHDHTGDYITVVGHGTPSWSREKLGFNPTMAEKREAMGVDWTNRHELSESIPPAYTEWIGAQVLAEVVAA